MFRLIEQPETGEEGNSSGCFLKKSKIMLYGKTQKCCVGNCEMTAVTWKGFLLKSRDTIKAGFCPEHANIKCPNSYGKKNCYGVYDKSLGEII